MQGIIFDLYLQCQQKQKDMKTKVTREIAKNLAIQAHEMLKINELMKKKKINMAAYRYMIANRVDAVEAILDRLKLYRDEAYREIIL